MWTRGSSGRASCSSRLLWNYSGMALTFASGSRAVPHATADDAGHGAFMTLPRYTRTREGEVPGTSSLPTFAHRDRLVDRIMGERASMREGQVTSLEQARCRAVFRDAQQ